MTAHIPTPRPPSDLQALPSSAQEFIARVLACEPEIAVFDCDGTLWSGDAGSGFMHWSIEQGLLSPERTAWLNERYAGYLQGDVSELAICGEMVQVYAGLAIADLRRAAAEFFRKHIEPHIFPEMAALIAELQHRGSDIWAVSSTCDWVIEEGTQRFGIRRERFLAARVAAQDGYATDRLLDVPTDEGKVAALHRHGITQPDVVFGNSVHDAAMLRMARRAFPVNPSLELAAEAGAQRWPVYFPAGTKPSKT